MELRTGTSSKNHREIFTFMVLFLLASLPYANTLFNNFVYDDGHQVVDNPYVHSFRYLREIFTTTVWSFQGAQGPTNYYRPLMSFGYLLCYQIAGLVPFTFHLVNIVLQAAVVFLVFRFLRSLSGEQVALIAAGLFALHPIHTESVAWIAAITDLELAVFYLLAFLLYLRISDPARQLGWVAAMCASLALALLSKEQAITLPVLASVFEHFYREDRATTSWRQKWLRYAPLWTITVLYLAARAILLGGLVGVVPHSELSWYEVGISAIALTGGYLWKLIWPAHLSAFYVFHKSSHLTDGRVLLGLAGIALCGVVFVALWRHAHMVSFGMIWMFITLGPVLNARWMSAGVFAERYLYLPSIAFCWILGWAAVSLWRADAPAFLRLIPRVVPMLLAAVALLYAVKTVTRNRDWRSDETLFTQTVKEQPDATLMTSDLGAVYFNNGDLPRAEHEWLKALSTGSNNVFALDNLALLRQRQRRFDESLDYSGRALRIRPTYVAAHLNLAETLVQMGRLAEAEWQFRMATTLSPLSARAHNNYGKFLFDAGRLDQARTQYERSVAADDTTEAYDHLGDIYFRWQDFPRAEHAYRHGIALNPFDSHAHIGLGQVLESTGRTGDALREYQTGLETDPTDQIAKSAATRLRGNTPPKAVPQ